jgi:hypothetical protein
MNEMTQGRKERKVKNTVCRRWEIGKRLEVIEEGRKKGKGGKEEESGKGSEKELRIRMKEKRIIKKKQPREKEK